MKKVALIIGHSFKDKGAVNYLGESELDFNLKVAGYVDKNFNEQNLRCFMKEGNYVAQVNRFMPDLVIELHFNSFKEKAYGCEALVLESSVESKYEAQNFLNEFYNRFKIEKRGVKRIVEGGRGFKNLDALSQYPMFLFEPCFANFKTSDSKKIIKNWKNYGDFLIDYLNYYFELSHKVEQNILSKMIGMIRSWKP